MRAELPPVRGPCLLYAGGVSPLFLLRAVPPPSSWAWPPIRGRGPYIRGRSPYYTWARPPLYAGGAPTIRGRGPLYTWARPPSICTRRGAHIYVGRAPYTWAVPPLYAGAVPSLPWAESPSLCGHRRSWAGAPSFATWPGAVLSCGPYPYLLFAGRVYFRRGPSPVAFEASRGPRPLLRPDWNRVEQGRAFSLGRATPRPWAGPPRFVAGAPPPRGPISTLLVAGRAHFRRGVSPYS